MTLAVVAPRVGDRSLLAWLVRAVRAPGEAAAALAGSPAAGWWIAVAYSVAYAGTAALLAARGFVPVLEPLLPIEPRRYYARQVLFTLPVGVGTMALGWVSVIGCVRLFSGNVDGGELWGPFALAMVVPTAVTMWVPETVGSVLSPPGNTVRLWSERIDAVRQLVGVLWAVVLAIVAIDAVTTLSTWQSGLTGLLGSAVTGLTMPLFLR